MKIALLSYTFAPAVGGIETVSSILAKELAARGHQITVLTFVKTRSPERNETFRVVRCPNWIDLATSLSRSHVVLQSNVSLRLAWPLYLWLWNKPFLLVHHTPIARPDGHVTLKHLVKRWLVRRADCFSVSRYMAGTLDSPSRILPNPYASGVFVRKREIPRTKDILFVGRLVFAKGLDTLLNALAILRDQSGAEPNLTIAGAGPEDSGLKDLASRLCLSGQVTFVGSKSQADVAEMMNEHRIVAVPSRPHPPEALPLVAIEAIACGCVVVASNCGGLPEAVGNCGTLFESENAQDLATCLLNALRDPSLRQQLDLAAREHLAQFEPASVIDKYERYIEAAVSTDRRTSNHGRYRSN